MRRENRGLLPYPFGRRHLWGLLDDLFSEEWASLLPGPWGRDMKVDIHETDTEIVLEAELPGVSKENIEIILDDNYLTLRANQDEEKEVKKENYLRKERRTGSLVRTFLLPAEVKEDEAKAKFENGLLELRLPKKEPAKSTKRRINIE